MSKPGLYGMRWKERKLRRHLPLEGKRKRWLIRRSRETMADYVYRTKKVFAWGGRNNSNSTKKSMGCSIVIWKCKPQKNVSKSPRAWDRPQVATPKLGGVLVGCYKAPIPTQGVHSMARRNRDGTVKTGPFGPYRPMRGAWNQAIAIQTKVTTPTSPTEARLQPAGKSYELTYRGINKLRDWN